MGDESSEDVLANKTETERALFVLDLLDRLETALDGVSQPHKVLATLKFASTYCIANGVQLEEFISAATQVFHDAQTDVALYAQQQLAEDDANRAAPATPDPEATP